MTDKDIIKALECCTKGEDCKHCPLKEELPYCSDDIMVDAALDLINRQQAEIERLQKENNESFDKWNILEERTKKRYAELYQEAKSVVRAEAIKEFAEKLKENITNCHVVSDGEYIGYDWADITYCIDNLVKEMVED